MLTIVNYGVGNLASIQNMLKKIGVPSLISDKGEEIQEATQLILPGVGAFDTCVEKLESSGLLPVLNKKVIEDRIPVLGVCVGMQLLLEGSEEGLRPGLGWIKGKIVKFKDELKPAGLKIPPMGWSDVTPFKESRLFRDMYEEPRFYFVHSYHPELNDPSDALVHAEYGYRFVAGVERENILGVQFHPEKSHKFGMKLLNNFSALYK
ncbi:MAG: imidazole glycerol phosphate synthase subunit HisH [Cyclobacteriaceae bacterium]|nr:imidazole glycerol phosphate synthase subunit HisH [Cyclobacteriaceae bacterium]